MDAQNRVHTFTPETARPASEQGPDHNGGMWREFEEPRGWALKWDGEAMFEAEERRMAGSRSPAVSG